MNKLSVGLAMNRRGLIIGIGILSVGLIASLVLLMNVYPGTSTPTPDVVVVTPSITLPETQVPVEVVPDDNDESATEAEVTTDVSVEELQQPSIGNSESQLLASRGTANSTREVVNAYLYEYNDITYVLDETQATIIGYWLYAGQTAPIDGLSIDWESGFDQSNSAITWQGPYENDGRGSNHVLYGYGTINGQAYTIEFGADDQSGHTNQVITIYER